MVVLTGDMVSGYAWDKKSKDFYYKNWKKFTRSFLEKKVLYAYSLGNHDHQADYDYKQIMDLDKTHPYSLFNGNMEIDPNSVSNYVLEIKSSIQENQTSALLWLFDSKDTGCMYIKKSWGCITQNQINWYETKSMNLNRTYDKNVKGFSFFHIPPPEFMNMWNFYPTEGTKGETNGCPKVNTGFFKALKKNGNMKAIFCGHDHNNDYSGFYKGIELKYGRKTGYGSYGPKGMVRGGTVIKLKEIVKDNGDTDFTYDYYTIQEDGEIIPKKDLEWQGFNHFQLLCEF